MSWQLYRRSDGRIECATSARGDFEPSREAEPWQFSTKEAAQSAWRRWANIHPAWAQDWLPEVKEVPE